MSPSIGRLILLRSTGVASRSRSTVLSARLRGPAVHWLVISNKDIIRTLFLDDDY